jgi:lipopolysaccharide export system permease protein
MKKIDIYIIKKFLGTFFYAIALLVVIVIVFDLSEKIDDFIKHDPSLKEIIFDYYFNFIPYFVNLFAYLFTFISVIFFTSKMASNTEIIAILSSGISFRRFLRPYMISAVFLTIFSFVLANFIIPHTNKVMSDFENKYFFGPRTNRNKDIHMKLGPETYAYVQSFNAITNVGHQFSMEKVNKDGLYYKITSDRIIWDSINGTWNIENFVERKIDGMNETIYRGVDTTETLNLRPTDFVMKVEDIRTMGLKKLNQFIEAEKVKGTLNINEYLVARHKRISGPFATIILTLIGVALSSRKVRGGMGMNLGVGIAITFAYILFMQISTVFATYDNLSPFIAAWIPNIIFGILAVFLIRMAPK